jgi:hypothetical protein
MFFSDKTSSAALTVLFAETEKKPACFFTSSNCFAVFLGLSIAISPPLSTLPRGLQAGTHLLAINAPAQQIRRILRIGQTAALSSSRGHGCIFCFFVYASNRQLHRKWLANVMNFRFERLFPICADGQLSVPANRREGSYDWILASPVDVLDRIRLRHRVAHDQVG